MDLNFGIEKAFDYIDSPCTLTKVCKLNKYQFISFTKKNICIFENNGPRHTFNKHIMTGIYIEKFKIVIYIPEKDERFYICYPENINEPVFISKPTNQHSTKHILFSEKSNTLICFGLGIKTFTIVFPKIRSLCLNAEEQVKIEERASFFDNFVATSVVEPVFDYDHEHILIARNQNLIIFNLDGERVKNVIPLQSSRWNVFSYNHYTKSYFTQDVENGICYWSEHGALITRFILTLPQIVAVYFLNAEFCLILDCNNRLFIVDLEVQEIYPTISVDPLIKNFLFVPDEYPYFISCGMCPEFFMIKTYWKLWIPTHVPIIEMKRFEAKKAAARIMLRFPGETFQFVSARTGRIISYFKCSGIEISHDYYYDRLKSDRFLVQYESGDMEVFQTSRTPFCAVEYIPKTYAKTFCIFERNGIEYICVGSMGIFNVYETQTYNKVKSSADCRFDVRRVFYDKNSDTLIIICSDIVRFFAFTDLTQVGFVYQDYSPIQVFIFGVLITGYRNGKMTVLKFKDGKVMKILGDGVPPHDGSVTSISKGSDYFITTDINGNVIIWSSKCQILRRCKFPLPISSSCVLNGTRTLLLATNNGIMSVAGNLLFDHGDERDDKHDNFDELIDEFELPDDNLDILINIKEDNETLRRRRRRKGIVMENDSIFNANSLADLLPESDEKEEKGGEKELSEAEKRALINDMIDLEESNHRIPLKTSNTLSTVYHKEEEEYYEEEEEDEDEDIPTEEVTEKKEEEEIIEKNDEEDKNEIKTEEDEIESDNENEYENENDETAPKSKVSPKKETRVTKPKKEIKSKKKETEEAKLKKKELEILKDIKESNEEDEEEDEANETSENNEEVEDKFEMPKIDESSEVAADEGDATKAENVEGVENAEDDQNNKKEKKKKEPKTKKKAAKVQNKKEKKTKTKNEKDKQKSKETTTSEEEFVKNSEQNNESKDQELKIIDISLGKEKHQQMTDVKNPNTKQRHNKQANHKLQNKGYKNKKAEGNKNTTGHSQAKNKISNKNNNKEESRKAGKTITEQKENQNKNETNSNSKTLENSEKDKTSSNINPLEAQKQNETNSEHYEKNVTKSNIKPFGSQESNEMSSNIKPLGSLNQNEIESNREHFEEQQKGILKNGGTNSSNNNNNNKSLETQNKDENEEETKRMQMQNNQSVKNYDKKLPALKMTPNQRDSESHRESSEVLRTPDREKHVVIDDQNNIFSPNLSVNVPNGSSTQRSPRLYQRNPLFKPATSHTRVPNLDFPKMERGKAKRNITQFIYNIPHSPPPIRPPPLLNQYKVPPTIPKSPQVPQTARTPEHPKILVPAEPTPRPLAKITQGGSGRFYRTVKTEWKYYNKVGSFYPGMFNCASGKQKIGQMKAIFRSINKK